MKVVLIAAISADGFIARANNELADWTSPEDKKMYREVTKRSGVMIMGRTTYDTIGRPLPGRRTIVYTSHELDNAEVETTQEAPAELLKRLEADGYEEVMICGGQQIYDLFLNAGVVDELSLTVEPTLFGEGISLFATSKHAKLQLTESSKLNENTLLLKYEVQK